MLRRLAVPAAFAVLLAGIGPASADPDTDPLHRYVNDPATGYGYDTGSPVSYYPGSPDAVEIPREYERDKHQFRSSWVATISNLHFPQVSSVDEFTTTYREVLDGFSSYHMNAVTFQVRPLLDAYYPSEINPWSQSLTGSQGGDPGFDPLAIMVDETHRAGMEYHAWFNPYRVSFTSITSPAVLDRLGLTSAQAEALTVEEHVAAYAGAGLLAEGNFAVEHPDLVLRFDGKLFLDPGEPAVRQHVVDSVMEVARGYDVDAIHFDDYFYPYRITVNGANVAFGDDQEDRATFEEYGLPEYPDDDAGVAQWRRDNVTALVEDVKAALDGHNQDTRASVQFGISPFGIWRHHADDPLGSHTPTTSSQSYDGGIYADTRDWVRRELVDYVTPQIYWSFDQAAAPYGELARWWNDVATGTRTQLYIGHANYKHVANGGWDPAWMNPEEIPNQLRFNQLHDQIAGSALYSYADLLPSDLGALDPAVRPRHEAKNRSIEILHEYFDTPTLVPAKPWLGTGVPAAPQDVVREGDHLAWTSPDPGGARYFVVYRGRGDTASIVADPANIVTRMWAGGVARATLELDGTGAGDYVVTTTDAAGVESAATRVEGSPASQGTVRVEHRDESGGEIAPADVLTGTVGEPYEARAATVEGYEVVGAPSDAAGVYSGEPRTVVFTYRATTVADSPVALPRGGDTTASPAAGSQGRLPRTGSDLAPLVWGVVGLLVVGGGVLAARRRRVG